MRKYTRRDFELVLAHDFADERTIHGHPVQIEHRPKHDEHAWWLVVWTEVELPGTGSSGGRVEQPIRVERGFLYESMITGDPAAAIVGAMRVALIDLFVAVGVVRMRKMEHLRSTEERNSRVREKVFATDPSTAARYYGRHG